MKMNIKRYNLRQEIAASAAAFLPDVVVSATDYDELKAEVARLRGDAERYRWAIGSEAGADLLCSLMFCYDGCPDMISKRIDAAMAKEAIV